MSQNIDIEGFRFTCPVPSSSAMMTLGTCAGLSNGPSSQALPSAVQGRDGAKSRTGHTLRWERKGSKEADCRCMRSKGKMKERWLTVHQGTNYSIREKKKKQSM